MISGPARAFADSFASALEKEADEIDRDAFQKIRLGRVKDVDTEALARAETLRVIASACRKAASE
jgi:hypothetical protein